MAKDSKFEPFPVMLGSEYDPETTTPVILSMRSGDIPPGGLSPRDRVRKVNSEPGDYAPDGTVGTIMTVLYDPELGFFYFVGWDIPNSPPMGITAGKVELVSQA